MATTTVTKDLRAMLTCMGGASIGSVFPGFDKGPMSILSADNGVIFPYVPTILIAHQTNYASHEPTHSNFVYRYFRNYQVSDVTCTGMFTAHTLAEARYMMGAHHFFKSAMRMGFGENDEYRGIPPPVLEFSAYGHGWFESVPVVIGAYSYNMDGTQDYVPFEDMYGNEVLAPLKLECILTLMPQYSTRLTRTEHRMEDFVNGSLLSKGYI